eukprot:6546518-Prymnesium_polylepis.1
MKKAVASDEEYLEIGQCVRRVPLPQIRCIQQHVLAESATPTHNLPSVHRHPAVDDGERDRLHLLSRREHGRAQPEHQLRDETWIFVCEPADLADPLVVDVQQHLTLANVRVGWGVGGGPTEQNDTTKSTRPAFCVQTAKTHL